MTSNPLVNENYVVFAGDPRYEFVCARLLFADRALAEKFVAILKVRNERALQPLPPSDGPHTNLGDAFDDLCDQLEEMGVEWPSDDGPRDWAETSV